jgi:tripartite ATP-independent transporter DctM subunit
MTAALIAWVFMLLAGTHIFVSLGIASIIFLLTNDISLMAVAQRVTNAANSFPLLSAPFFILMGNVMNNSGVTRRMFNFASVIVGWMRGGLGHANVVASMLFAGMSGTAVADAGGLGNIEIKAMTEAGYDVDFAAGITASSAVIGPIIPPSLPMVIYSVLAGVSLGRMFLGGVLPGVTLGLTLMIMVGLFAKKRNYPKSPFPSLKLIWFAFKESFWAIMAPVILFLGITTGIFTPTEAAIVAAFYSLVVGGFIYKDFALRDLPKLIVATVETNGVVLGLVMTAVLFGWVLAVGGIPKQMAEFLIGISSNKFVFILIVNVFLLLVGCFMEGNAAQMILVPILAPIALQMGIDPVQFGILVVFNLMVGTVTPPVGIVLFVTANVARISFERVMKAAAPFFVALLVTLILISYWPPLTTFIPDLLMGTTKP